MKISDRFRTLASDQTGATAIEYALIATLISVAAITAMGTLGNSISGSFETASTALSANSN
jgi:pilus assembly protein Flp/PilA